MSPNIDRPRSEGEAGLSDVTPDEWQEILNMDPPPDERPPVGDFHNHD